MTSFKITVVIPCFRVKSKIRETVARIPSIVDQILIIDDSCPEQTGNYVKNQISDPRIQIIQHSKNQGVGGALISGYRKALEIGADVVVKIDGDGQMDPAMIPRIIRPILDGKADYTKGNRFYRMESLRGMPFVRVFGNAVLSFISKISSGYWNLMDPTNGYTAIHRSALSLLPLEKIDRRYFFESDMLFRLNTIRAVIQDVPMDSKYEDEISSLRIGKILFEFPFKHLRCFLKRLFYTYVLRDFNIGSLEILMGTILFSFGTVYGLYHLQIAIRTGLPSASGVVMLAALPVLLGVQLLLSALNFDILNQPQKPLLTLLNDHSDIQHANELLNNPHPDHPKPQNDSLSC